MSDTVAVVAATAAACCYGGSSALQHLAAGRQETAAPLDVGLLARLLRSPAWLLGQLLSFLGIAGQAVALRLAPVLVVQPILVLGLPVAVVLRAYLERGRVPRRDLATSALCAVAIGVLVLAVDVHDHVADVGRAALVLTGACIAVAAAVAAASTRTRHAAVLLGACAGALLGIASVLLRAVAVDIGHPTGTTFWVLVVLMLVAALLGLLLAQTAFQRATIAAPLAVLTLAEPVAAVLLARPVLGESASFTPVSAVVAGVGLAVAVWAVVALARADVAPEAASGAAPAAPVDGAV